MNKKFIGCILLLSITLLNSTAYSSKAITGNNKIKINYTSRFLRKEPLINTSNLSKKLSNTPLYRYYRSLLNNNKKIKPVQGKIKPLNFNMNKSIISYKGIDKPEKAVVKGSGLDPKPIRAEILPLNSDIEKAITSYKGIDKPEKAVVKGPGLDPKPIRAEILPLDFDIEKAITSYKGVDNPEKAVVKSKK